MSDKLEHYAHNMWSDKTYQKILDSYEERRRRIVRKRGGILGNDIRVGDDDCLQIDAAQAAHIRNWFENPIYQTILRPTVSETLRFLKISECMTVIIFITGLVLVGISLFEISRLASIETILSLLFSGTANLLLSLFRAVDVLKDVGTRYSKIHVAVSAGLVTIDSLQRILGGQLNDLKNKEEEMKNFREIAQTAVNLVNAFESSADHESKI